MEDYIVEENYPQKKIPYVTIFLAAVNVIIFLIIESVGSTEDSEIMYQWGAMYSPDVFEGGQWYRIITSMFLHFGINHLLNNMVVLLILGYQMEEKYGRLKYLITYFVCGIVGNIISGAAEMAAGSYTIGAGASGAVFGIFGVILVMVFKSRKQFGRVSAIQMIVLFLLMVFGNTQEGVDWMAHLGGALCGVVMALVLYKPKSGEELLNL